MNVTVDNIWTNRVERPFLPDKILLSRKYKRDDNILT